MSKYTAAEYAALQREAQARHEQMLALTEGRTPKISYKDFQASLAVKHGDPEAMADAVVKACTDYLKRSVSPLVQRIADLEARLDKLEER